MSVSTLQPSTLEQGIIEEQNRSDLRYKTGLLSNFSRIILWSQVICIITASAAALVIPANPFHYIANSLLMIAITWASLRLARRGYYWPAAWLLVGGGLLVVLALTLMVGTVISPMLLLFVPVSLSMALLKTRHAVLITAASLGYTLALYAGQDLLGIYRPLLVINGEVLLVIRIFVDLVVIPALIAQLLIPLRTQAGRLREQNRRLKLEIVEHQKTEAALRASYQTNQAFQQALPDLLFCINAEGVFLDCQAGREVKQRDFFQRFIGRSMDRLFPPELARELKAKLKTVLETQQTQLYENSYTFNNKVYYFEARFARVNAGQAICIVRDITQRKEYEQKLIESLAKEKELSEMKTRFVSTTSHEFRTPLTIIMTTAELLQAYGHQWTDAKREEMFGRIKSAVGDMTELLDDILIINKAEAGKLEFKPGPLDILQFCRKIAQESRCNDRDRHPVRLNFRSQDGRELADTSLILELDARLVGTILKNILQNALKYSPEGSSVDLEVIVTDAQLTFRVQDAGRGIPEADRPYIFNLFHRGSNTGAVQGSGLGLAIAKKSVELHGGQISFESREGAGSRFEVVLPLTTAPRCYPALAVTRAG